MVGQDVRHVAGCSRCGRIQPFDVITWKDGLVQMPSESSRYQPASRIRPPRAGLLPRGWLYDPIPNAPTSFAHVCPGCSETASASAIPADAIWDGMRVDALDAHS